VFGVRGEELEGADGQSELIGVGELSDAHAQGHELVPRDGRGAFHDVLSDVIHALRRGDNEMDGDGRVRGAAEKTTRRDANAGEDARDLVRGRDDSAEEIQPCLSFVPHRPKPFGSADISSSPSSRVVGRVGRENGDGTGWKKRLGVFSNEGEG
jgi:hypothetical protein